MGIKFNQFNTKSKLKSVFLIFAMCLFFLISCEKKDAPLWPWETIQEKSSSKGDEFYVVKWVSDGDTFWIEDGTTKGLKVRLSGIDAPESVDYGSKMAEEFGKESHMYAERMLKGKKVRLEYDVMKYDKYGRTLAYAFLEDGTFVNRKIVSGGYAVHSTYAPNYKYMRLLLSAQDSARRHRLGLWNKN